MLRYVMVIGLLGLALPASAAGDLDRLYARWESLRDPAANAISFTDGNQFLIEHPGWPEEKLIRLRTEAAALNDRPGHDVMAKFCADNPPISGRGMFACAVAKAGDAKAQEAWITQGWIQGDFNEDEEERIFNSYRDKLTRADHIARAERLLYEGKSAAAKRMLALVPADKRKLYDVRIAFIKNEKHVLARLAALSPAEQREPGILFERMRWRIAHDQEDQLAELFAALPKDLTYPDLWWPMRAIAVREAMGQHDYNQALTILTNHGTLKPEALADALWLKGWLMLQKRNDAGAAYKQFFALYTTVYTPVSKARAAYWAGRAADKNGNPDIAKEWMTKAARYPTVFYGQLAHVWLSPDKPLALPAPYEANEAEKKAFNSHELVRMAKALHNSGDKKMRDLFLTTLANKAENEAQFTMLANLADELSGKAAGVEVAKQALRNGVLIIPAGWPRIDLPKDLAIEDALALSISRQESEFDPEARSPANARGLMQLLPSTAKHVAKQLDMPFRESMLDHPEINVALGSHYLGQIIDGFDGSYILGIASYNAGPGSVRRWISTMGRPPKNLEGAVDWVETIPFGETRNYVMRVIENVGIYRTLIKPEAPLHITQDLTR